MPQLAGYDYCGSDAAKWAQHAGDPNYNLINECCQQMNREETRKRGLFPGVTSEWLFC